jgi:dTDP-4-dehydrorhamnose reductase
VRVAVFGPSGMLGRQVIKSLVDQGHTAQPIYTRMFELLNKESLMRVVEGCDAIINCAGVIPVRNTSVIDMIYVNSMFPHVLASLEIPTILISTDCVFGGRNKYRYAVNHIPDPRDYYGRSKSLGEAMGSHTCVVRTSFIGCEHGFMHWVLSAGLVARTSGTTQRIEGWKNALWTGSTVCEVARGIVDLVKDMPNGIIHLATEQVINKHDLAMKIIEAKQLDLEVVPTYHPILNRALEPTHRLKDIDTALAEYVCVGAAQ